MSNNHRIIFLSLSIFSSSLAIENSQQNNMPNPPIKITSLGDSDISEIIRDALNNQQHHHHHHHTHHHHPQQQQTIEPIAEQPVFSALKIEEITSAFKYSPKEAQYIIHHLYDPTFFQLTQDCRSKIFFGEPGTGKTTTAEAIAYKMSQYGWEYKFLPSTLFLGEHRNQAAILLQKELEAIKKSKKKTILIIDELNLLMEHSESKNHDTDATAKVLWAFLDQQKNNNDFFFIGTMNRINKLPQAYKSRIILNCIKFPLIDSAGFKRKSIRENLTTKNTSFHEEVTDAFLDEELKKMGSCSDRDLNNLSNMIRIKSKINILENPDPNAPATSIATMKIKKAAIAAAIDQYVKDKIQLNYDFEEETDEERQNRHHKENLDMQDLHFVQQQMIQLATNENQVNRKLPLSPWGINYVSPEGLFQISKKKL